MQLGKGIEVILDQLRISDVWCFVAQLPKNLSQRGTTYNTVG